MNPNKFLTLFMGKCWHEWEGKSSGMTCKICGLRVAYHTAPPLNPDFSQLAPRDGFIKWVFYNRRSMFEEYCDWRYSQPRNTSLGEDVIYILDLSNFADFLCLPETIEQWGWEECPTACNDCLEFKCEQRGNFCHGTGKILVPWARYASEKPVQISDKEEATDER